MRIILAATLLCLVARAAQAQLPGYTPAPVPNALPNPSPPADRAGRPDGADRSAPFSGLPTGVDANSGQATPSTVGTPEKQAPTTPSLSR